MQLHLDESVDNFTDEFKKLSNIDLYNCYQCGKCTAGCPVAGFMDKTPNQIIRFIQLNQPEIVLNSKTPYICASCNTCSARCPKDIDIARVMETIRILGVKKGIKPKVKGAAEFNKLFLKYVKTEGRSYELGMTAEFNIRTGQFLKDAALGAEMFMKRKISLLPEGVKNKKRIKKIFEKSDYFVSRNDSDNKNIKEH